jgi:hypothetical protein
MRRIGRNHESFPARNNFVFSIDNKFEPAALYHADLFVGLLMEPRHGSFRQLATHDGHGLCVDHLALGQRINLLLGYLTPLVELHGLAPK